MYNRCTGCITNYSKLSTQAFEKNELVEAVWPEEASDGKLHFYPGRIMQVRLQGYLAHKKTPPPWDLHRALVSGLL